MHPSAISSAARAQRILAVWQQEDLPRLEAELSLAQRGSAAAPGAQAEEQERLELLEGIAGQMQRDLVRSPLANGASGSAAMCFRLLEHLAAKRPQAINQSEKLFSSPYSRSARKISACR